MHHQPVLQLLSENLRTTDSELLEFYRCENKNIIKITKTNLNLNLNILQKGFFSELKSLNKQEF